MTALSLKKMIKKFEKTNSVDVQSKKMRKKNWFHVSWISGHNSEVSVAHAQVVNNGETRCIKKYKELKYNTFIKNESTIGYKQSKVACLKTYIKMKWCNG